MNGLPPDTSHRFRVGMIVLLTLVLLVVAGSVAFMMLRASRVLDERQNSISNHLISRALEQELETLSNWAYDYGFWEDSVNNLIKNLDRDWADDNIGGFLFESFGINASLVYDAANQLIISFKSGQLINGTLPFKDIYPKITPLLKQARQNFPRGPRPANGLIEINGTIYLAAAQAIVSENAMTVPNGKPGVLVLFKEIDTKLLGRLAHNYKLKNLSVNRDSTSANAGALELTSATGERIGALTWEPDHVGREIARTILPSLWLPFIATLLLTAACIWLMWTFSRRFSDLHQNADESRKQARVNDDALRAFVEAVPSPMFYKNADGFYMGCNDAFCNYIGFKRSDVVGHTVHDVAPEDLANIYHQADLDLMTQGGTQTYEAQVRYADGVRRDILFNKACITNSGGKVTGLVGIMTDISDIKTVQRESRHLRKRLRNIIDSMPSLLITVDDEQRVTEWNRWAASASRVAAGTALGKPLLEVFPALAEQNIDVSEALQSGQVRTWQRIPWKFRGRDIFVDLTVYPLDKTKGSGAVLRADNATHRVQMEEVMVLSEKMISISSLAAGMAHEINNPLAIILQHTQILGNRLSPQLDKNLSVAKECGIDLEKTNTYLEQRGIPEMLDAIRKAGDRARLIVEEMVNFTQRHEPRFAPENIEMLIKSTLHLAETDYELKKKYAFRNIKIELHIAPELPSLTCDAHDLQQVILNLLRNSAKALFEANIQNPKVTIDVSTDKKFMLVDLADNGPGIAQQIIGRIFDPFFTTGKPGEGTGLGLSAAYFIVCEKHSGDLRVENNPVGGCSVHIKIPLDLPCSATEVSS